MAPPNEMQGDEEGGSGGSPIQVFKIVPKLLHRLENRFQLPVRVFDLRSFTTQGTTITEPE
jgi:hypothetical protein